MDDFCGDKKGEGGAHTVQRGMWARIYKGARHRGTKGGGEGSTQGRDAQYSVGCGTLI